MRYPLGLSSYIFNTLNSYNPTKDPLPSTQIHLRDPCIETSKGGQVGANQGGKKGKKQREATEAALQPGVYDRAQSRQKKLGCG